MTETKQIRVSKPVWRTLKKIKRERGHTNFDSAFRDVLFRADIEILPPEESEDESEDEDGQESGLDGIVKDAGGDSDGWSI